MGTNDSVVRFHGRLSAGVAVPVALLVLWALGWPGAAAAQDEARQQTITWTASAEPAVAKPAGALTLTLHAAVRAGWHVYGLKQLPGGPTPLHIALDPNPVAAAKGHPSATPATKVHDPGFDLDVQYYSHAFSVSLPVRLQSRLGAGRQLIPLSVRFQTCNDRVCQPPKIVHLTAPVAVLAGK